EHPFAREVTLLIAQVLRRFDATARSFFAVVDGGVDSGSAFAGSLLEVALACDRVYMLDSAGVTVQASGLSAGAVPTGQGLPRLALRQLGTPGAFPEAVAIACAAPVRAAEAAELGLVTVVSDDIDFADEVRMAVEERVSLSPDALTGMEASLRFA